MQQPQIRIWVFCSSFSYSKSLGDALDSCQSELAQFKSDPRLGEVPSQEYLFFLVPYVYARPRPQLGQPYISNGSIRRGDSIVGCRRCRIMEIRQMANLGPLRRSLPSSNNQDDNNVRSIRAMLAINLLKNYIKRMQLYAKKMQL